MNSPPELDEWVALARAAGSIDDAAPHTVRGGSVIAREALALVVDEDFLLEAMQVALSDSRASEMARSILALLRPLSVIEPLSQLARDSSLDDHERTRAIDVLQAVARPEAALELYAMARAFEGPLHEQAAWSLTQTLLGMDRRFPEEDELTDYVCSLDLPSIAELAQALRDEAPDIDGSAG